MMDAGPAGGEGRRRGKKNRGRQNRRRRTKAYGNRSLHYIHQDQMSIESYMDDKSILGGRQLRLPERKPVEEEGPPDAFALFSAYYLGVTATDGYHKPQLEEVARRFKVSPQEIKDRLTEFSLDEETIRRCRFDLKSAQLDIRVAPEGVSRTEIARDHFEIFMTAREDLAS